MTSGLCSSSGLLQALWNFAKVRWQLYYTPSYQHITHFTQHGTRSTSTQLLPSCSKLCLVTIVTMWRYWSSLHHSGKSAALCTSLYIVLAWTLDTWEPIQPWASLKELFLNILTECLLTLMTSVAEPEQRNCAVLLFQHLGVLYLKTVKGCRVPGPGLAPGVTDTRL